MTDEYITWKKKKDTWFTNFTVAALINPDEKLLSLPSQGDKKN